MQYSINIRRSLSTLRFFLPLTAVLLVFSACEVDEEQQLEQRNYSLVWSDDFDGAAGESPDPNNWNFDIGTGDNGWGNQELQFYTDRTENVSMDGQGNLVITARRETFGGMPFTSGRITTKDKFEQQYGRFEARMKTPYGPGIWPAFWLLGANIDTSPWPQCGEIDVMELRGQEPNKIAGSLHGPGYSAGDAVTSDFALPNARFDDDFYIFAIEWGEDYIDYFVNDRLYQRITPEDADGEWVFDAPFYMLLNVAVGGTYVGFPTSQTPFPQPMIIDYVRVYQQTNS
ncbi:family 16 glycosylhydrolase [Lewinella sp. W8]|uniref:glycoside hydrolase family 16 protein n=1 Tax=Lewinella sp. W8 TaxID=2528208 RepID=UPI0010688EDE|nr:glycoside hydrolase family 16 protein [Lewinella sp. W8]MTB50010.1 family 16 glycosylhydrolase [Lewinella sp. W8]